MGLRTASVRHPHVMVMAPALTNPNQSQNFKLSPRNSTSQSLRNQNDEVYHPFADGSCEKSELDCAKSDFNALAYVSDLLISKNFSDNCTAARSNNLHASESSDIMNNSPLHMGDHNDKMGLQKAGLDVSSIIKDNKVTNSDVDQLFTNIEGELPDGSDTVGGADADIGQNVDELMQVFKSMEAGNDRLGTAANDLGNEADSIFPLTNLASFEKELFNDVDVMSMSMEEQFLDGASTLKENHTKELISSLQKKHVKLERKLEFLLRRLRKLQSKQMGQHISEEVAGVFEHVHRTLRRTKDCIPSGQLLQYDSSETLEHNASKPSTSTETISFEKLKPISQSSAKNLVRKLEVSTALQANSTGRQRHITRYFGSGSLEMNSVRSALVGATVIPQWSIEYKNELQRVTGHMYAETRLIQEQMDSEATLSSSGGESCDEMQQYNNPHQQFLSIQKRAAWHYATERATIASRWTWLQAQIADLEYRIRQYSDLHKQIRASKGAIMLGGKSPPHSISTSPTAVNGYRGQLPGASPLMKSLESTANGAMSNADVQVSARTRPLINFKKRKLLQTWGLHAVSKKAARSSTIRCGCTPPHMQCAVCTGRTDPTRPRDISDYLSKMERISLLDPCFHPVFSLPDDASATIHFEAIMKTPEWQHRSLRPNMKTVKYVTKTERSSEKCNLPLEHQPKKQSLEQRRKYSRLIKTSTINALTAKIKNKFRGRKTGLHSLAAAKLKRKRNSERLTTISSAGDASNDELENLRLNSGPIKPESRSSSPLLSMQTVSSLKRNSRISSYDIDNIIIPYSVAASTRVERLQYKEILTPKWRVIDPDFATRYVSKNNGLVNETGQDSDVEDFSEEAVVFRHDKCENEERKRFLSYLKFPNSYSRSRSHKRTDSRAESSGCNTPDPMSPHASENLDTMSPLTSPPATPQAASSEDSVPLPSISALRRRTISQSRGKDKEIPKEEASLISENVEIAPFDRRVFPLNEETYDKMLKLMPEDHQFKTNFRSQDYIDESGYVDDDRVDSPDSETTESALGDEDPNDPEWLDMESIRDRYSRR